MHYLDAHAGDRVGRVRPKVRRIAELRRIRRCIHMCHLGRRLAVHGWKSLCTVQ